MADPVTIDSDLPDARSLVKFRNFDRCFVLTEAKARSDATNFREAATLLNSTDRAKDVAVWLNALADKYDQGELSPVPVQAKPKPKPKPRKAKAKPGKRR